MTEQKINKSDFVDRKGVAHPSIGENIRSDNNQLSVDYLNNMSEEERNMFPFFPFKKGKWETAIDTITNGKHNLNKYFIDGLPESLLVDYRVKYAFIAYSNIADPGACLISTVPTDNATLIFFSDAINLVNDSEGKTIILYLYVEDE